MKRRSVTFTDSPPEVIDDEGRKLATSSTLLWLELAKIADKQQRKLHTVCQQQQRHSRSVSDLDKQQHYSSTTAYPTIAIKRNHGKSSFRRSLCIDPTYSRQSLNDSTENDAVTSTLLNFAAPSNRHKQKHHYMSVSDYFREKRRSASAAVLIGKSITCYDDANDSNLSGIPDHKKISRKDTNFFVGADTANTDFLTTNDVSDIVRRGGNVMNVYGSSGGNDNGTNDNDGASDKVNGKATRRLMRCCDFGCKKSHISGTVASGHISSPLKMSHYRHCDSRSDGNLQHVINICNDIAKECDVEVLPNSEQHSATEMARHIAECLEQFNTGLDKVLQARQLLENSQDLPADDRETMLRLLNQAMRTSRKRLECTDDRYDPDGRHSDSPNSLPGQRASAQQQQAVNCESIGNFNSSSSIDAAEFIQQHGAQLLALLQQNMAKQN